MDRQATERTSGKGMNRKREAGTWQLVFGGSILLLLVVVFALTPMSAAKRERFVTAEGSALKKHEGSQPVRTNPTPLARFVRARRGPTVVRNLGGSAAHPQTSLSAFQLPSSPSVTQEPSPDTIRFGIVSVQGDPTSRAVLGGTAVGNMTYHGGQVQHTQKVFTIFWRPSGYSFPSGFQATINQFVQDLNGSSYYGIASQYSDGTGNINTTVVYGGTWLDTVNGFPETALTYSDLLAEVNRAKTANGWTSDSNSYFQIYTPSGIANSQNNICGVHYFNNPAFGQILTLQSGCGAPNGPYPNNQTVDAAIDTSAHEIMETVTDPFGNAWYYQDAGGEIGDLCRTSYGSRASDGSNVTINGHHYAVQQEWSNSDNGCVFSSASACSSGTSTLRNIDNGPPIHPPGSVVKVATDPTVYLIDTDNRKRPITSASVLAQLYNQSTDARTGTNFSNWVITIAQDELDVYEQGGNISAAQPGNGMPFPDGKLIGYNGEISIVTGVGKRRPFATSSTFTGLGFNFCQVVNVSSSEYNSYPVGPPVEAMPLLTSSVNLSPAGPYTVGQNISGTFTVRNVGSASIPFSSLGIGGRLNGSTVYDIGFVSTTLAAGSSYSFASQAVQLASAGTYDFFAAYQETDGHWAISVPAAPGVIRSRQITVTDTMTRTLTVASSNPSSGVSITVSPNDNNNQGNGTTQFTRVYNNNQSVTLNAPSTASGNNFQKWQRDGSDWATTLSTNVTMDANHTMSAIYVSGPTGNAVYDSTLKAPKCGQPGSTCDSGTLLNGRDSIAGGQEPNQPNTIFSSCADNTAGSYHLDESIDKIRVSTLDGSNIGPGKTVKIEVTVWAFSSTDDFLDLFHAPDATNPNWTYITTLMPPTTGGQVLSTTFTLPSGGDLQAVRANFLYQGGATPCSGGGSGNYDDHDDLIFSAQSPVVTRTLTAASSNPSSGVSITVSPNDNNNQGNGTTQFTRVYNNNQTVNLNAPSTASGNNFQKWQRDGSDWVTTLSTNVTMDANHTMTAVYASTPPLTRTLTVASSNPSSGVSITVSPNDNNNQGNGVTQFTRVYNNNQPVNLNAPSTASGNNFQKWQRDGSDWAFTPSTNVTMDANHTMTAVYNSGVSTWANIDIGVGADNRIRSLWDNVDGRTTLWVVQPDGTFQSNLYGPYSGWTARAIAAGADNLMRVLWTHTDGSASLWTASGDGSVQTNVYGPYSGWTAVDIAAGSDNLRRVLWTNTNGTIALWVVSQSGSNQATVYGPYAGWTARRLATGSDNKSRVLWTHTDGTISLWVVAADNTFQGKTYGPYAGWTGGDIAVGSDNKTRVLWNNTNGSCALWVVQPDGTFQTNVYGPYAGWTAKSITVGSDNKTRVLWNNTNGSSALWVVAADGSFQVNAYGPY